MQRMMVQMRLRARRPRGYRPSELLVFIRAYNLQSALIGCSLAVTAVQSLLSGILLFNLLKLCLQSLDRKVLRSIRPQQPQSSGAVIMLFMLGMFCGGANGHTMWSLGSDYGLKISNCTPDFDNLFPAFGPLMGSISHSRWFLLNEQLAVFNPVPKIDFGGRSGPILQTNLKFAWNMQNTAASKLQNMGVLFHNIAGLLLHRR